MEDGLFGSGLAVEVLQSLQARSRLFRGLSTATHTSRYVVLPGLSCCVGIDLQGDDILLYSIFFYPPKGVLKYMAQQDCSRMVSLVIHNHIPPVLIKKLDVSEGGTRQFRRIP